MSTADHTIRLSADAWRRLQRLAEHEGVSPEKAAERAVEREFRRTVQTPPRTPADAVSAFDLVADLAGSFDGPEDLSTNKAYLEGFGEHKKRPQQNGNEDARPAGA